MRLYLGSSSNSYGIEKMSTFNFYNQKKGDKKQDQQQEKKPEIIRQKILEAYDKYTEMMKSDLTLKEMAKEESFLTSLILKNYNELKRLGETNSMLQKERVTELNQVMSTLDLESEKLKQRKSKYLETQFQWLKSNYPAIFDMIIGVQPPARETFESVLGAFLDSEKGRTDRKSAMKNSLETLRKKHNLPTDFFDYGKLNQYC